MPEAFSYTFISAPGIVGEKVLEAKPTPPEARNPLIEGLDWSTVPTMPEEISDENPIPTLRISLMGQGAFGMETYQKLKEQGHQIGVVYAPSSEKDALRKQVLKDIEEGAEVDLYELSKEELEKDETPDNFKRNDPDLGVFASMTIKVKKDIFDAPKMGTIGYHNSELPQGRGGSAAEHAISKGKERTGISIYQVTDEADAGDYFLQAPLAIWDTDTPFSLNSDTYKLGVQMLADAVEIFARGKQDEVRHAQIPLLPEEGFIGKPRVDWSQPSREVYNFLRGTLNKAPYSELHPGEEVDIDEFLSKAHDIINFTSDIALLPDRKYEGVKPGTIVEINDAGIIITTGDGGAVRVGTLQKSSLYKGRESGRLFETKNKGKKLTALEMKEAGQIQVGQELLL
jgi:methionyl-tRNA formyltransferase